MVELEARHGDHHFVNVKYGYIIFALSLAQVLLHIFFKFIFIKRWEKSGLFSSRLSFLASPPTWLSMTLWVIIILAVAQYHIGVLSENYITLAKRLGRVSYSLVPLNIYLVLRFPYSANLSCGYYLQSLNLHKWMSRLIFLLALLHGAAFTYKWTATGTLSKFFKLWNFLGLLVLVPFILLIVVSVRVMRRKWYSGFYIIHNITAWFMVVLISLHARPGVLPFAIVALALLALQLYLRFTAYRVNSVKSITTPTSSLQIIQIPTPLVFPVWLPASHIRLNYSFSNIKSWTGATHPFTIASTYEDASPILTLITRKTQFEFNPSSAYLLSGPYPALPAPFFSDLQMCNIICGGSGISFALPIFQYLKVHSPKVPVQMVWCVRNSSDLFIRNHLDMEEVEVYVTGVNDQITTPEFVISDEHEENHGLLGGDEIELRSMKSGNGDNRDGDGDNAEIDLDTEGKSIDERKLCCRQGRPKLHEAFAINNNVTYDVRHSWVLACGPDGLIKDAQIWAKDHGFNFFSEKYEM
ncbi:uncharacterized protein LODBEIA_P46090 [Lodderomyces beijingensis]|uniref:Metalloreductase AIM14 n=1 Tax=Lodderomyces beijingensis TaxID=1775926 RepID=A0ABP0ZT65_9ASCO